MRKETYLPVETPIGILHHRDAVYMDSLHYDGHTLVLKGNCNGDLATDTKAEWVRYALRFVGVLAFRVLELDSWFHHGYVSVPLESSLWEVQNSAWQARMGGKVTSAHRHFSVLTYDDVIDVVCQEMEFLVGSTERG